MEFKCRNCNSILKDEILDLGHQPPSNAYLYETDLDKAEIRYPLKLFLCPNCKLVQLPEHASSSELFTEDYAYFSSTSSSWCSHAKKFVEKAISKLDLNKNSFVVELASNDGYLLQYFKESNIPCLGVEPTLATANACEKKGIKTLKEFFGNQYSSSIKNLHTPNKEGADLIIANNVLAHVPDINDFIGGIKNLLKKDGKVSVEFPHLLNLIKENQFDTIYHEHYSYFSISTLQIIVHKVDLKIIEVEELTTHGGSLRVWLTHKDNPIKESLSVEYILKKERDFGILSKETFNQFRSNCNLIKLNLLEFLIDVKRKNKKIIGYGAAAKGNTLLNYLGITKDLLPAVIDKAKSKQGKFLPGSHIPILDPSKIEIINPDYILVLPWNLIDEIKNQLPNKQLITAIPELRYHF